MNVIIYRNTLWT